MEHLPEDFVSNTFVETNASHAPAPEPASPVSQEQQAAIDTRVENGKSLKRFGTVARKLDEMILAPAVVAKSTKPVACV